MKKSLILPSIIFSVFVAGCGADSDSATPSSNENSDGVYDVSVVSTTQYSDSELSAAVLGQEVAIKGVYLGMLKSEYEGIAMSKWTVATHKVTAVSPRWAGGRLDSFTAHFNVEGFEDILAAVNRKYPDFVCIKSGMQNNFGAKLLFS